MPTANNGVDTSKGPVFVHNWRNDVAIDVLGNMDVNADESKTAFKSLKAFMTGFTPASGDTIDTASYFIDEDNNNPEVTGHAKTIAVTGNTLVGDPACDYLRHLEQTDATGNDAKTLMRLTYADGTVRTQLITIENIVFAGGNGNAKSTFTCTFAYIGKGKLENDTFDAQTNAKKDTSGGTDVKHTTTGGTVGTVSSPSGVGK